MSVQNFNLATAADDVLSALKRKGGELSVPELVKDTALPHEVVVQIVNDLVQARSVTMLESEGPIPLVRVRSPGIRSFVLGLFRGQSKV